MQTDNILILALEKFSVVENNKFSKVKLFIKLKKVLALKTPLIFNKCVLI